MLLRRLLEDLQHQITNQAFTYAVVIVDNDNEQSAKIVVDSFRNRSQMSVDYYNVPEQNIALARNKAIQNSRGEFVAFLDDDEFPINTWLYSLYMTYKQYKANGVLGPVKPHFETDPPDWIVKGKICERKSFATGTIIKKYSDTRTGNVLFEKTIFNAKKQPFNPSFGKTGGEDVDFFRRMMEKGFSFVWCDEAVAYETVPSERLTRKYYLKRALMRGRVAFLHPPLKIKLLGVTKSTAAIIIYSCMLPFCFIAGQHVFMKYLIRYCDHLGKVATAIGIEVVREGNSYNATPES